MRSTRCWSLRARKASRRSLSATARARARGDGCGGIGSNASSARRREWMSSSIPTNGDLRGPGRRGKLKVFLGYAAGVGKTFRMLEEAQELRRAGGDVVVGHFEPHARRET